MKKKFKRIMCIMCTTVSLLGSIPVYADTSEFDVTTISDVNSYKTWKVNDGDNFFYATPTYFNKSGTFDAISIRYDKQTVMSNDAYLSSKRLHNRESAKYRNPKLAIGGKYYFMQVSSNTNGLRAKGRYTP